MEQTPPVEWATGVVTGGPTTRTRHRTLHRTLLSWRLECPVRGTNCVYEDCPRDQAGCPHRQASFVDSVQPDEVLGEAFTPACRMYEIPTAGVRFSVT